VTPEELASYTAELIDRCYPPDSLTEREREEARNTLLSGVRGGTITTDLIEAVVDQVAHALPDEVASVLRDRERFTLLVQRGGQVNAQAARDADGRWIIGFDEAMISALYGVARTMSARISSESPRCEGCGRSDCPTPSVARTARRMLEYGLRAVWFGHCGAEDWPLTYDQIRMADAVAREAETFVVAHEVGHQALDHPAAQANPSVYRSETTVKHADGAGMNIELHADMLAGGILLDSAVQRMVANGVTEIESDYLAPAVYGAETFFTVSELLDRCRADDPESRNPHSGTRVHPNNNWRRTFVEMVWENKLSGAGEAYERLSRSWRSVIDGCWATLAAPSEHDVMAWWQDWLAADTAVRSALAQLEEDSAQHDQIIAQAAQARAGGSQLLFDRAAMGQFTANPMIPATLLAARLVRCPLDVLRAVDPTKPALGLSGLVFTGRAKESPFVRLAEDFTD
jgi:hypothetical protein